MLGRLVWMFLTATCWMCESAVSAPLQCPQPPAQSARDVSVETRAKLAALGKLGAGELQNKVQITVRPLLDNVPNSDKVLLATMLTSVFCQLLSTEKIDDREKLDRFESFSRSVLSMAAPPAAKRDTEAANRQAAPQAASKPAVAARPPAARPQPKVVGLGSTVKEVGEYLAGRPAQWTREPTYKVSFPRVLDGLAVTEEIAFDDNERAIGHSMTVKAERTSGRNPKTVGPEPDELCEAAPHRLVKSISAKLGAPTQPLTTKESRPAPVDWSRIGYDKAPCDPMSSGICEASARRTSSHAGFALDGSEVSLTAVLFEVKHRRAKTIASTIYEKSSTSCEIRIEDQSFAYLQLLSEQSGNPK